MVVHPHLAAYSDPLPDNYYLAQGSEDVLIQGAMASDRMGSTILARGDLNGDGFTDLVIGAPRAQGPSGPGTGQTYVFFGATSFPDTIDLGTSSADVTILGMLSNEWSGSSLACGDLNMDGFDDLAIGAPYSGTFAHAQSGCVYVLFGRQSFSPYIDLAVDSADVIIAGTGADYLLGSAVAIGEINGDGIQDLVAGSENADPHGIADGGEVYVFFGTTSWNQGGPPGPRINLWEDSASVTIQASEAQGHLGAALAVDDINGDVFDDILIGAPEASPVGRTNAGIAYVIFGWSQLPDTIDLNHSNAGITIYGATAGARCASSVAIGDFDFRSFGDIVLGAPFANPGGGFAAGEVYVILSYLGMHSLIDLNITDPDIRIMGAHPDDEVGTSVAIGDVNGDGFCDVFTGAPNADVGGETEAGTSYLIYGGSYVIPAVFDLGWGEQNVIVYGCQENDFNGSALTIGDINGDGFGDMIMGAWGADTPGGNSAGECYIINGDGDQPIFTSIRRTPAGDLPNLRFRDQNAWVDFADGGAGDISVSRFPWRPPNTSPWAAQVWWEVTTDKIGASIIQVTFRYTDEQISGLNEGILTLWQRPFSNSPFVPVSGTSPYPPTNRITAPVNTLGQFALSDLLHPLGVQPGENASRGPETCQLYPAAPNPFNSIVSLHYDLAANGHVDIVIFNVMGQEVATVVDDTQLPGQYHVSWDASEYASGIYFAVMDVIDFRAVSVYHQVEKLLLLR